MKGVCSEQTIQRMTSLVINAIQRQGETDGERLKEKGSANRRQDRSRRTLRVWPTASSVIHQKQQEQSGTRGQRFKKNVKVRAEAQKVKAGSSCPTSATRSTRISRESKRDETLGVQVHQR